MKLAVLKEGVGETRCAAIPETVKKFTALGAEVAVPARMPPFETPTSKPLGQRSALAPTCSAAQGSFLP